MVSPELQPLSGRRLNQSLALAIGAGPEQIGSILRAQDLGYRVLAVDRDSRAPGFSVADEAQAIDIRDEAAVIQVARNAGIDLTLPVPIGRLLTTQGAVHDALGLRGVSRDAALRCTDKALFHRCLLNAGVPRPWQRTYADDPVLWEEDGTDWTYPVVLKPTHGAGSRGVRVIGSLADWISLKQEGADDRGRYAEGAVLEAFVRGTEIGLDGAVVNGKVTLTLARAKALTPLPYRVELTYRAPAHLPARAIETIRTNVQRAAKALGITNSVFHADAIWTLDDNLVLLELSARPSGLMIARKLIPACTGVDFLAEAIRLHATGKGVFEAKFHRPTLLYYLHHHKGRVRGVPPMKDLLRIPHLMDAEVGLVPGQVLRTPSHIGEFIKNGYLLLNAESWPEIELTLNLALSLFEIKSDDFS